MIKSGVKLICDAGPIIHLDEISCLDLLNDFDEIIIPPTVEREIATHRPSALQGSNLVLRTQEKKIDIKEELYTLCRSFSLDAGETEALALMGIYPLVIFLTDDAAARLVAEQLRFNVHGTIGILVRSIRRGQKSPEEVLQILSEIPLKSSLYIKASLLKEIEKKILDKFHL